jgi:hypothetical protein
MRRVAFCMPRMKFLMRCGHSLLLTVLRLLVACGRVTVLGLLVACGGVTVLGLLVPSGVALAHDDPIVTVRVLCNGFNVLDMDAVLGEISTSSATLSVDRPVSGATEIEAWVREQMDHDLRIEIVDIGTPQRLADGYTVTWTARFSREDWRRAGVQNREVTSAITIHNGRITEWNASLDAGTAAARPAQVPPPAVTQPSPANGPPELFGLPVTLLMAIVVLAGAGVWMARRLVHRA